MILTRVLAPKTRYGAPCLIMSQLVNYEKHYDERGFTQLVTSFIGQFENFTYRQMKTMALYMLLVDPGMLNEIEG